MMTTPAAARSSRGRSARILVGIAAALSLVIAGGTTFSAVRWVQLRGVGTVGGFERVDPSSGGPIPPTGKCSEEPCNYLLLGSDSRTGIPPDQLQHFGSNELIGGTFRADTIMLVHTDPNLQKAIVLSFPRDLWVNIPGHGQDRINTAFEGGLEHGGPKLMAQTIANLSGLSIDHYVYVDLAGFSRVVDTLGGVEMCVPSYDVNTPGWVAAPTASGGETSVFYSEVGHIVDPYTGLDIKPGCQRLDGIQALAYVRTRHLRCDSIPDFSRIGRQQQFLRAVINQMLRPQQIVKAPGLVEPILQNLHRDSGLLPGDLVYLVGQLQGLTTGAAEFRAVPGTAGSEGTKSVVHMDPSARQIFQAIRDGKPISDVGTRLLNTPPSEANVTVAVVDDASSGEAEGVEAILTDAGFDIAPGIWSADEKPAGVKGPAAIVYAPGHDLDAEVVSKYFPGMKIVESAALRDASVVIVVTHEYLPPDGNQITPPSANDCPTAS